jgi:hypothetical protein
MIGWHDFKLLWKPSGCTFYVGEDVVLQTTYSPHGPLGFVCWIDNQYMVATARGRLRWGVLSTDKTQRLEIADLHLAKI